MGAPRQKSAPKSKKPKTAPPAQKRVPKPRKAAHGIDDDAWIDANVAYADAMEAYKESLDRDEKRFFPSRLEYFTAAALQGILTAPVRIKTVEGGLSASKNAVIFAKAVIKELDKETARR